MKTFKQFSLKPRNGLKNNSPKFWFDGKLISKKDHDKLSWSEIKEWNDQISRVKK